MKRVELDLERQRMDRTRSSRCLPNYPRDRGCLLMTTFTSGVELTGRGCADLGTDRDGSDYHCVPTLAISCHFGVLAACGSRRQSAYPSSKFKQGGECLKKIAGGCCTRAQIADLVPYLQGIIHFWPNRRFGGDGWGTDDFSTNSTRKTAPNF